MSAFGLDKDNRMFMSIGRLTAAEWSTKFVNDLPDSSFAYIASGGKKDADGKTTPRDLRKLPYKDADGKVDAPHVRNALARLDQTDGIPDGEKSKIKTTLQNALEKATKSGSMKKADLADGDEDISDLPNTIEILPSGIWDTPYMGQFAMTNDNLQEYLANAMPGGARPLPLPIDYDHGEYRGESAGWITSLFVAPSSSGDGTQSLWGNVEWTPKAIEAIEAGEYKYFSPEWWPEGYLDQQTGDEFDCVLIGGGIVNRPLFDQLTPITASEFKDNDKKVLTANSKAHTLYVLKGNDSMKLEDIVKKDPADLSDEEKAFLVENKEELNDEANEKFADVLKVEDNQEDEDESNEDEDESEENEEDEANKASKKRVVSISASELRALKASASKGAEAMAILEAKTASEKTASMLIQTSGKGHFPLTAHEKLTSFYMGLKASQKKEFEALVASLPDAKNLMATFGSDEDDTAGHATEKIQKMASERAEKDKIPYAKALVLIASENPALYGESQDELKPSKGIGQ